MKIGIVVLSWNSFDMLDVCLLGLKKHEQHPVYVVDNGSVDGSPGKIQEKHPQVVLIRSPGNLGFAEGCNVGIRKALADGCDAIFLLNNDTIIDEPFADKCAALLEADASIGVVGPVIVEGHEPDKIQCRGGRMTLWNLHFPFLGRGECYTKSERRDEVDWVLGAAMLIKREVFEAAGGLLDPEFYPAYVEEAELCYRARKAGYRSVITFGARVRHIGRQSAGGFRNAFRRMMCNRFLFGVKHLGVFRYAIASQVIVVRVIVEKLREVLRSWNTAS